MISRRDLLKLFGVSTTLLVDPDFLDAEAPEEESLKLPAPGPGCKQPDLTIYRGHGNKRVLLAKLPTDSEIVRLNVVYPLATQSAITEFSLLRGDVTLLASGMNAINGFLLVPSPLEMIVVRQRLTLDIRQQTPLDWAVSFWTLPLE